MTKVQTQPMTEHTKLPWWTDTEGRGDKAHNVICAQLGAHGTQVVVDDLNAGYLLDPDERYANAALIVEAVNSYASLKARIQVLESALRESLTENAWNAYHCGVTRADGKWMDGGMSDAEGLQRELGLGEGWHDATMIRNRIPEVVEKQIGALAGERK